MATNIAVIKQSHPHHHQIVSEHDQFFNSMYSLILSADEVQHLIEKCLILRMDRDECMKVLYKHAGIRPLVTLTVWRELQKENRGFFHAYSNAISPEPHSSNHLRRVSRCARKIYRK